MKPKMLTECSTIWFSKGLPKICCKTANGEETFRRMQKLAYSNIGIVNIPIWRMREDGEAVAKK